MSLLQVCRCWCSRHIRKGRKVKERMLWLCARCGCILCSGIRVACQLVAAGVATSSSWRGVSAARQAALDLPLHDMMQPSNDYGPSDFSPIPGAIAPGFLGGGIVTLISAVPDTSFSICCRRLTVGVTCIDTDNHLCFTGVMLEHHSDMSILDTVTTHAGGAAYTLYRRIFGQTLG